MLSQPIKNSLTTIVNVVYRYVAAVHAVLSLSQVIQGFHQAQCVPTLAAVPFLVDNMQNKTGQFSRPMMP